MQNCNQVLLASALNNHQILNKEAILNVPSTMQDTRARVK